MTITAGQLYAQKGNGLILPPTHNGGMVGGVNTEMAKLTSLIRKMTYWLETPYRFFEWYGKDALMTGVFDD